MISSVWLSASPRRAVWRNPTDLIQTTSGVVFDPKTIRDHATFTQPHQYSEGFELVLVNGKAAVEDGKPTGGLYGQVLTPGKR